MGSPTLVYPLTWMNGGPVATSRLESYLKPRSEGDVWLVRSPKRNLFRRNENRKTPTTVGEKVCVSWATKSCARWLSPIGNPGTLAPAGESGSKRVPSLIM